jgi:hypothetical protein
MPYKLYILIFPIYLQGTAYLKDAILLAYNDEKILLFRLEK